MRLSMKLAFFIPVLNFAVIGAVANENPNEGALEGSGGSRDEILLTSPTSTTTTEHGRTVDTSQANTTGMATEEISAHIESLGAAEEFFDAPRGDSSTTAEEVKAPDVDVGGQGDKETATQTVVYEEEQLDFIDPTEGSSLEVGYYGIGRTYTDYQILTSGATSGDPLHHDEKNADINLKVVSFDYLDALFVEFNEELVVAKLRERLLSVKETDVLAIASLLVFAYDNKLSIALIHGSMPMSAGDYEGMSLFDVSEDDLNLSSAVAVAQFLANAAVLQSEKIHPKKYKSAIDVMKSINNVNGFSPIGSDSKEDLRKYFVKTMTFILLKEMGVAIDDIVKCDESFNVKLYVQIPKLEEVFCSNSGLSVLSLLQKVRENSLEVPIMQSLQVQFDESSIESSGEKSCFRFANEEEERDATDTCG